MNVRWQSSNRAELAEQPVGFEWTPPLEPVVRWGVMPATVITTPMPGLPGMSGASWCVVCPPAGCASAECCRHPDWLEQQKAERDAMSQNYVRAPAKRARRIFKRKPK